MNVNIDLKDGKILKCGTQCYPKDMIFLMNVSRLISSHIRDYGNGRIPNEITNMSS